MASFLGVLAVGIFKYPIVNSDVSVWLYYLNQIHDTNLVMYRDIFEVNPPFAFALYSIPFYLNKFFNLHYFLGLSLLAYSLILLSSFLIYSQNKRDGCLMLVSFSVLTVAFIMDIVQREFVFIYLATPYLFIFNNKSSKYRGLSAALFAVAFLIKPFYLILFFFWFAWIFYKDNFYREQLLVDLKIGLLTLITFSLIMLSIFPEFLNIISLLPEYKGTNDLGLISVAFSSGFLLISLIFIIFLIDSYPFKNLSLIAILTSFIFGVYFQQKFFVYHYIPFLVFVFYWAIKRPLFPKEYMIQFARVFLIFYIVGLLVMTLLEYDHNKKNNFDYFIQKEFGCSPKNTAYFTHFSSFTPWDLENRDFSTRSPSSYSILTFHFNRETNIIKHNYNLVKDELESAKCIVSGSRNESFYPEFFKNKTYRGTFENLIGYKKVYSLTNKEDHKWTIGNKYDKVVTH